MIEATLKPFGGWSNDESLAFWECIMAVKVIPDGYHTATPYLVVKGGRQGD